MSGGTAQGEGIVVEEEKESRGAGGWIESTLGGVITDEGRGRSWESGGETVREDIGAQSAAYGQ